MHHLACSIVTFGIDLDRYWNHLGVILSFNIGQTSAPIDHTSTMDTISLARRLCNSKILTCRPKMSILFCARVVHHFAGMNLLSAHNACPPLLYWYGKQAVPTEWLCRQDDAVCERMVHTFCRHVVFRICEATQLLST